MNCNDCTKKNTCDTMCGLVARKIPKNNLDWDGKKRIDIATLVIDTEGNQYVNDGVRIIKKRVRRIVK